MDPVQLGLRAKSSAGPSGALSGDVTDEELDPFQILALSLSRSRPRTAPESRKEVEVVSHILPRVPNLPDGSMTYVELATPRGTPEVRVDTSPRRRPGPPKVSRLGLGTPPWIYSQQAAFDGPSQLSREAAAAKQMALQRHRQSRSCTPARPKEEPLFQAKKELLFHAKEEPLFQAVKTPTPFASVLSSRQRLRQRHPREGSSGDPLAGSPFSKDAQLDPLCQRLGIYDAQQVRLSRRFAVVAAGWQNTQ